VNLTRYHGIFAAHARERTLITPADRRARPGAEEDPRTPEQRRQALTWAQRLKRVFEIDVLLRRRDKTSYSGTRVIPAAVRRGAHFPEDRGLQCA